MKKILLFSAIAAGVLMVAAKAPKDPVLMTVNGDPVTLGEFEYYYHKNDGNEIEHETPEQYLQRFIDYKLKVQRARDERQDTTAAFIKDFRDYRRELAEPYMTDTTVYNTTLHNSYLHTLKDVKVDHLMIALGQDALMDSLRNVLVNGGDFEAVVAQYSIDPGAPRDHGHYGFISAGEFPYEFEEIAFETPLNEWSPVAKTAYGLHLVRPVEERPNIGEIRAAHILVQVPEGADDTEAKARIDSIYNLLENNASFEQLARTCSDCPSKAKSGDLGFFGRGKMVPEFEEVAFALTNNSYSKPFKTRFGWHIVKKYEERKPNYAEVINYIKNAMKRDGRHIRPRLARANQLRKEYGSRYDEKVFNDLMAQVDELGYDSVMTANANNNTPLIFVADSVVTVGEFFAANYRLNPQARASDQLRDRIETRQTAIVMNYEDNRLEQKYPEFRNLAGEYRDGLMLVASLEQNVWNRPTEDPEGLKAYFEANRANYSFSEPRWKGYIIYSTNDSIVGEIDKYLARVQPTPDQLNDSLRTNFPGEVRIERAVLPKGENATVDFIAFGGDAPRINSRWKFFTTYLGGMINAPEEVADVRNRVTNDWTAELEKEFVNELRKAYPVKVNKKILKKAK